MEQVGVTNYVPVLLDGLKVFVRVLRRDLWVLIDAVHKVTSLINVRVERWAGGPSDANSLVLPAQTEGRTSY